MGRVGSFLRHARVMMVVGDDDDIQWKFLSPPPPRNGFVMDNSINWQAKRGRRGLLQSSCHS